MIRFLSHRITPTLPVYGKFQQRLPQRPLKQIAKGDSCNSSAFEMENHWGTHVDAPNHFSKGGKKIDDYEAGFWYFTKPCVLSVRLKPGQLLHPDTLKNAPDAQSDLLLFKSGWSKKRNRAAYSLKGPGVHADMAAYLRGHCNKIRAIGFDWISLSSFSRREEGRAAHRAFLAPAKGRDPILIIEDMDLSHADSGLRSVVVSPLRLAGADGAPCTVFGLWS